MKRRNTLKEELQQIANKHDMELKEVVEVAKELLDKIEEEMAEFEVGDTVMTPDGIGVIGDIDYEAAKLYWVEVKVELETLMNTMTTKKIKVYFKDELNRW